MERVHTGDKRELIEAAIEQIYALSEAKKQHNQYKCKGSRSQTRYKLEVLHAADISR